MAETVWTTGKLTAVYNPVGRRADGSERFRRAAFDLLEWASVEGGESSLYVNTLGFQSVDDGNITLPTSDEVPEVGREFGYYTLNPVIIEPHKGNGSDDTWWALHSFGYI